jgi:two-component system cell cycle sensor histidine kinase/response regulator CckA
LTRQLLAFSRRQTLLRRSVNLNDTLSNLMSMLRRIIGEDVEIRCRQQPGLCSVLANSGQIEQVIMNLAVNARDAMPDGGLLLIATRNVTLDEAYCREHAWAKPGHYVLVSVSDNGVGMDAEVQRRIFEPFFTTKQVGKGTGLGLSVVYGIVKQHDALIHVDSSPGHGTTFRIYFKADEPPAAEESREEAASVRGGNETVLVAEDEPALRGLAKNILEGLGYRVLLAENGERAVAECERAMNEIDLFVLDLMMPRMGGREAYERIRALRSAECPVIFMTGHAHETLRDELVRSRSAEIVQKPYQLDELGRKVRDVLDARPRAGSQLRLGIRTKEISDSGALQT